MLSRKRIVCFLLITLTAAHAHAGDAEGPILDLWASPISNFVMFTIDDPKAKWHRCNTSGRYAIDVLAPGGRATLEVLLLAKRLDLVLYVKSLNTCNQYDAENARHIIVH